MEITQVARNGTAAAAGASVPPPATGEPGEHEIVERRRGFEEGTMWAREFATDGQIRALVRRAALEWDLGVEANLTDPYWDGFLEGAEEVLATGSR